MRAELHDFAFHDFSRLADDVHASDVLDGLAGALDGLSDGVLVTGLGYADELDDFYDHMG